MFPSPSGASIFLIDPVLRSVDKLLVSVPFRGFYISNAGKNNHENKILKVSVTFRGFYISNREHYWADGMLSVSVPFRGFYISNLLLGFPPIKIADRFRPLPGLLYF